MNVHIVWNRSGTEGFVTVDSADATRVATGKFPPHRIRSTVRDFFHETYGRGGPLRRQKVLLPPPPSNTEGE